MNKALIAMVLTLCAIPSSGCGTVCNLAGGAFHPDKEPRVYGGVLRDIEVLDKAVQQPARQTSTSSAAGYMLILGLGVADPILSFIGDTLTLPVTIYLQNKRIAAGNAPASPDNASGSGVSLGIPTDAEPSDGED